MKVLLSIEDFNYLKNNLLKNRQELLHKIKYNITNSNCVDIFLDENIADEIRELASDELVFNFDENYLPTKEGRILELFIDKFYFR